MSNSYYTATGTPGTGSFGASAPMRGEFDLIEEGFALLPTLGTPNAAVVLDAQGDAMTLTGTLAIAGGLAITGAFTLTLATSANVTLTMPSVSGLTVATLTGTETLSNKTLVAPALGTPVSGNLANCTGYPVANLSGVAAAVLTWMATPSSDNLRAAVVSTSTGTGSLVFATTPTLVTPVLGVATATSIAASGTITAATVAIGGATIGSNALAVTGTVAVVGAITLGAQQSTQGSLILANTAAGAFPVTLQSSNSTSAAWSLTLPTTAGTTGQALTTNGSGVGSWTSITSALTRTARTSNTILASGDKGNLIDITSGTFSQTFTAAATLGSGWFVYLRNSGTGIVTLDPNASETIDGLTTFEMYTNEMRLIECDGSNFTSQVIHPFYCTYTTTSTFVTPPGYTWLGYDVVGAGGGGGSGRRGAAGSARAGGGGGGGGGRNKDQFLAPAAGTSITATVAAGGTAGAAQTANDTDGSNGGIGGTSSLGSYASGYGGGAGTGGTATSSTSFGGSGGGIASAGAAAGADGSGGNPAAAGVTGSAGGTSATAPNISFGGAGNITGDTGASAVWGGASGGSGNHSNTGFAGGKSIYGGGGGGGGGAITSGNAAQAGGAGGISGAWGSSGGGGAGGAAGSGGTAGSAGAGATSGFGSGGGGGHATTPGAGATGGAPGGGAGGGGASTNGASSGAGGVGGRGEVRIWGIA